VENVDKPEKIVIRCSNELKKRFKLAVIHLDVENYAEALEKLLDLYFEMKGYSGSIVT